MLSFLFLSLALYLRAFSVMEFLWSLPQSFFKNWLEGTDRNKLKSVFDFLFWWGKPSQCGLPHQQSSGATLAVVSVLRAPGAIPHGSWSGV